MNEYQTNWLSYTIPYKNNRPEKCARYGSTNQTVHSIQEQCSKTLFNESQIIGCDEFIFKTDEHRIMKEVGKHFMILFLLIFLSINFNCVVLFQFGILCDENEYKLALVGTINNIGGFLFMPLTGVLSDK